MKVLAIIPARGGSKGIPGKNLRMIGGRPLVDYTLETASEVSDLDKIVLSSDDPDILNRARHYPKVYTHLREPDIAGDTSPVSETVNAILGSSTELYDVVMLLQPTAPLRTAHDIRGSLEVLISCPDVNSVVSVIPMDDVHPARMYWRANDGLLSPVMPEYETYRRQDIPPAYYRNGCIYLVRTSAFLSCNSLMATPQAAWIMPYRYWLNIDDERDLLMAESLIGDFKKHQK